MKRITTHRNDTMASRRSVANLLSLFAFVGMQSSFAALRELSTDRPDTTESPYTVDAGHFQIEAEIASWTRDRSQSETALGQINLKYGLDQRTDLQWITPTYSWADDGSEGWGNVQIRLKRNLWGNDEGNNALAVMPYVELPTGDEAFGSDRLQGGVIIPFAFSHGEWGFGLQGQIDRAYDNERKSHHWEFMGSATASHPVSGRCSVFCEVVTLFREGQSGGSEYSLNTGMTWLALDQVQWDAGIRIGLNDEAPDLMPFLGYSTKF